MGKLIVVLITICVNLSLFRCNQADLQGIVIYSSNHTILLATELSYAKYEKIKNQSPIQIQNDDVLGDAYYGLITLNYEEAEKFNAGDQIKVWLEGEVLESYPLQGTAKNIVLKKEAQK